VPPENVVQIPAVAVPFPFRLKFIICSWIPDVCYGTTTLHCSSVCGFILDLLGGTEENEKFLFVAEQVCRPQHCDSEEENL
jgi:hypothetical protein